MSDNNVSYLKSGIWYTVGNILIKGVSFVALPIFTHLLSPDDFGKYNVFMSYECILTVILGLGFGGTIKIAYFDFKEKFPDYLSSIISLTIIVSLLFDVLSLIGYFVFFKFVFPDFWTPGLVNLLVLSSLGTALYSLISTKYVIYAEYKANLAISFIYTITNVLFSVFLCYTIYSTERYMARIVGYTVPIMFIAYGISAFYIFKSRVIVNKKYWLYALKLGTPLIIHSLSMTLLMHIGKLMINYIDGDAKTGIYSVAVTIANILTIVLGSIDNAWAPWFYRGLNDGKYKELVKGNNQLSIVFAVMCSCFLLLSPEMIHIMTSEEYYDGLYSLVPLVVSVFINFMYLFAVNQEYFYKKTKTIAVGTVIATLCGIILNYLLIPVFGYIAAAYVSCISSLVLFSIHTTIVRKWGKPSVVRIRYLFVLLAFISFIGFITISMQNIIWVRIIILLIIFAPTSYLCFNFIKQRK